eukprot:SAG31_NODE_13823_length_844_cov_0.962416_1_plen_33_part_01
MAAAVAGPATGVDSESGFSMLGTHGANESLWQA